MVLGPNPYRTRRVTGRPPEVKETSQKPKITGFFPLDTSVEQSTSSLFGGYKLSNKELYALRQRLRSDEGLPVSEWQALAPAIQQNLLGTGEDIRRLADFFQGEKRAESAVQAYYPTGDLVGGRQPVPEWARPIQRAGETAIAASSYPLFHVGDYGVSAADIAMLGTVLYGGYVGLKPQLRGAMNEVQWRRAPLYKIAKQYGAEKSAFVQELRLQGGRWAAAGEDTAMRADALRQSYAAINKAAGAGTVAEQRVAKPLQRYYAEVIERQQAAQRAGQGGAVRHQPPPVSPVPVPRATQTGAMAKGGTPSEFVPAKGMAESPAMTAPVTPKITPTELPPDIKHGLGYPEIDRLNLKVIKEVKQYDSIRYQTLIESPPTKSVERFDIKGLGDREEGLNIDTAIAQFTPTKDPMEGNVFGGNIRITDKRYTSEREFVPLQEKDSSTNLWRGMSGEEWQDTIRRGLVSSKGEYNLGDIQKGATYFSEDASQALNYSAGFAPWSLMPTWTKPAVVIQIKRPSGIELITGIKPEVGIKGNIPISNIEKVYEIRLVSERSGSMDVIVDNYTKKPKIGSRSAPSQSYAIREVPKSEWSTLISTTEAVTPTAPVTEMAPSTSVQTGLPGMGEEAAQAKMLEEWGTAPGAAGQRQQLVDVEAIKAAQSARPLEGQEPLVEPSVSRTAPPEELLAEYDEVLAQQIFLQDVLAADPVATWRFEIGQVPTGRKPKLGETFQRGTRTMRVGFEWLTKSVRDQAFPTEYVTVKQARIIDPEIHLTQEDIIRNKVRADHAFDKVMKELRIDSIDELAERVDAIKRMRSELYRLNDRLATVGEEIDASLVPTPQSAAEVAGVTPAVEPLAPSEMAAVAEVGGSPPKKPPKNWDKLAKDNYDRFKKQEAQPVRDTGSILGNVTRIWPGTERITHDEFARLNWLGWQVEVDVAMIRAVPGQAGQLWRETMKSMRNDLKGNEELIQYVDDYLILRHQIEVMKATGRKTFQVVKGGKATQFTSKQIGMMLHHLKTELGAERYAKVKLAASRVPTLYNHVLKQTEELTTEQINGLIKKYPWYNPVITQKETSPININQKLSPRQIKQLTNLNVDKDVIPPLQSLPGTILRRMEANAVNAARKSIAEATLLERNKGLIGGSTEVVTKKPAVGAFFDYYDKGVRKYVKLGKGAEWMAKDIDMFHRMPPNQLISFVRSLQGLSKSFFTTYNPGFMLWNTAFDGMVVYFSEGVGPYAFGKALLGNVKAIFTEVEGVERFRLAGGEMMGYFEKGSRIEGPQLGDKGTEMGRFISTKKGVIRLRNPEGLKRLANPFELIRELGVAGENAARRAAFEKALKEGLSDKEAALRGRRATVDFSRFSVASRHINDWFIYFNPALQGFWLPGRAIAKNPRTLWRLAALIAGYIGLTFYNQSYDEYDDVRDSDKQGKLLVMLPSDEYNQYGNKEPHYVTLLPMREFALFTGPIEWFMGKLRTEDPEAYRTWGENWGYLYPSFSPLSMISESGGLVMPTQVASTFKQVQDNHDDFHNRPIVDEELALLPEVDQYDEYTDKLCIRIGRLIGYSPKKLDFIIQNMFGQLGGDVLRAIELAVDASLNEKVDSRIAALVKELRDIPTKVPPGQITLARETFLETLSVEDRQLVLSMERMPEDEIPIISGIFSRFYRDYGGQVYATAKEKALTARTLEDYPPEALEQLQKDAVQNAGNLLAGKITKYEYDQNRTRYRAYYSGGSSAQWREAMQEGAVSRADVERYMPEAYKRSAHLQAVTAFMEIRQKYIDEAVGVFNSETWNAIEEDTLADLRQFYSEEAVQYALAHKDDWIDNLPEPARSLERRRAVEIEDETWWDEYRGEAEPKKWWSTPQQETEKATTPQSGGGVLGPNPYRR